MTKSPPIDLVLAQENENPFVNGTGLLTPTESDFQQKGKEDSDVVKPHNGKFELKLSGNQVEESFPPLIRIPTERINVVAVCDEDGVNITFSVTHGMVSDQY